MIYKKHKKLLAVLLWTIQESLEKQLRKQRQQLETKLKEQNEQLKKQSEQLEAKLEQHQREQLQEAIIHLSKVYTVYFTKMYITAKF